MKLQKLSTLSRISGFTSTPAPTKSLVAGLSPALGTFLAWIAPLLGVPAMRLLRTWIRNCPEPLIIENGGHFLQEWGQELTPWFLSKT